MRIDITLDEPPSTNRYWRIGKGRTYLSAEARAYKESVYVRAISAGIRMGQVPFKAEMPIRVTLKWYRSIRSGDLDNRAKVALDALNGILWVDDKQIVELHLYRYDRPRDGALYVTVEG